MPFQATACVQDSLGTVLLAHASRRHGRMTRSLSPSSTAKSHVSTTIRDRLNHRKTLTICAFAMCWLEACGLRTGVTVFWTQLTPSPWFIWMKFMVSSVFVLGGFFSQKESIFKLLTQTECLSLCNFVLVAGCCCCCWNLDSELRNISGFNSSFVFRAGSIKIINTSFTDLTFFGGLDYVSDSIVIQSL